jgi:hypothetical protein
VAWFSVPVLVTIDALLEFICIPAWRFATGDELVDSVYVQAMFLTLIGLTAFWIGSLVVKKKTSLSFVPEERKTSNRVAFMSAAMLVLGAGGKLVMWKLGLYSYISDRSLRESSLPFIQWLTFLGNLLTAALIVSAIEVLGKRSAEPFMKIVFWLSLVFAIGFGVISGMKSEILLPLLYLVLAYGITHGRIPRVAYLFILLPVLIYPFSDAYRNNLNNGFRSQINTVDGVGALLEKSFGDVITSGDNVAGQGFNNTASRLSALTDLHNIIGLTDPSVLKGDETVWLAPLYPLVPRALWKDKPVLNKGQRLSLALGRPNTTSSAVTIFGDLYTLYGTLGVVVGLFLYGVCLQRYMNWITKRAMSEIHLFFYLSTLLMLNCLGSDVVAFVANAVQSGVFFVLISYVIYSKSIFSSRVSNHPRAWSARRVVYQSR